MVRATPDLLRHLRNAPALMMATASLSLLPACVPAGSDETRDPEAVRDSIAAEFGRELVDHVERSDTAGVERLAAGLYTQETLDSEGGERAAALGWFEERDRYGPLAFHSVTPENGDAMVWLRGTVTGAWLGVRLGPDEAGERFMLVGIRRGTAPPDLERGPRLTEDVLGDSLRAYVDAMARRGYFQGSVLVARGDTVLLDTGVGTMDPATGAPITSATRFNIASTGKMFTGVALARLAQDGRLSLDDPLSRFVPEFPARIADRVTLRSLLTHTSGIELDDVSAFQEATYAATSVDGLLKAQLAFVDSVPALNPYEPSGEFDYTNEGINLAGVVIERASGESYPDYMRRRVFEPAGMRHSGFLDGAGDPVAVGLTMEGMDDGTEPRPNTEFLPAATMPAGGHVSTTGDLLRFSRALSEGRLLDPAWKDSVTSMQVVEAELPGVTYGYGYGFEVIDRDGFELYGHAGGMPGASTKFEVYPELGLTIVVLSNRDGHATTLTNHIRELALRR